MEPATRNVWGTIVDQWPLLNPQGAKGVVNIGLAGTAVTLTVANNATDQERYFCWWFTGALTADCTVTIPDIRRVGVAINGTTGGFNVRIATSGSPSLCVLVPGEYALWGNTVGVPYVFFGNGYLTRTSGTVALTNGVNADLTSLTLPLGGYWEVSGSIGFTLSVSSNNLQGWCSNFSTTAPSPDVRTILVGPNFTSGMIIQTAPVRLVGGTAYLGAFAGFASGTASAGGTIRARRIGGF